jgi:hypothetical protein
MLTTFSKNISKSGQVPGKLLCQHAVAFTVPKPKTKLHCIRKLHCIGCKITHWAKVKTAYARTS